MKLSSMKLSSMKLSSLVCGSVVFLSSFCAYAELCIGTITYPASPKAINAPHVYFEGRGISVDSSSQVHKVTFELDIKNPSTIHLLIVNGALKACCKDKGIPTELKIPEQTAYKYFSGTQQEVIGKDDPEKEDELQKCFMTWVLHEQELTDRKVPKQTIIIMLDPALIKDISSPTWDILNNFIPLPHIALKDDPHTTKYLCEQATHLQLAALEMNTIHEPQKPIKKINHGPHSLTIPQGCTSACY